MLGPLAKGSARLFCLLPKICELVNALIQVVMKMQQNAILMRNYRDQPYNGRVILFKARSSDSEKKREIINLTDNGWGKYVENLEIYQATGEHKNMVYEPYVEDLVKQVKLILRASGLDNP